MMSLSTLRRIHRVCARAELRFVDGLPDRPHQGQLAHAWHLAERTTAALRAIQVHPDYPVYTPPTVTA